MADQGDLPRALRFAVSQIQPGSTGPPEAMNEQDRAWLNEVLGQVAAPARGDQESDRSPQFASGIPTLLLGLVRLLGNDDKGHMADAVKNELEHIAEEGELMDRADDMERKNSVEPIAQLFTVAFERSIPMVASLCSILAELAQNSPDCQAEAMKLIPTLLDIVRGNRGEDALVKTKAVYALSAIIRGNPSPNVGQWLYANAERSEGIIDVLVKLIIKKEESTQLRTKSAFLLSCLVDQHEVRQYLSRHHEAAIRDLDEQDTNIKELVESTLKRIHTNRTEDSKGPLALAM